MYIKSKNEINYIIDYCIDNNMELISINLKNCNDKLRDCENIILKKTLEIGECHINEQAIELDY